MGIFRPRGSLKHSHLKNQPSGCDYSPFRPAFQPELQHPPATAHSIAQEARLTKRPPHVASTPKRPLHAKPGVQPAFRRSFLFSMSSSYSGRTIPE